MMSIELDEELFAGINKFIADRNEPPIGEMTHSDAVNVILRDWLMGQGYLALPGDPDAITPALEAAGVPKA